MEGEVREGMQVGVGHDVLQLYTLLGLGVARCRLKERGDKRQDSITVC
jgi:hypothetical protein